MKKEQIGNEMIKLQMERNALHDMLIIQPQNEYYNSRYSLVLKIMLKWQEELGECNE